MTSKRIFTLALVLVMTGWVRPVTGQPTVTRLVSGLEGASGSTVGPDGALYVAEGAVGRISRVDPKTGQVTTFASGLPRSIIGFGGPTDIAFIGKTAYVIVTLVGPSSEARTSSGSIVWTDPRASPRSRTSARSRSRIRRIHRSRD